MKFYIKFTKRGLEYTEIIEGETILSAIGVFYSAFGYQSITKVEKVG